MVVGVVVCCVDWDCGCDCDGCVDWCGYGWLVDFVVYCVVWCVGGCVWFCVLVDEFVYCVYW